MPTSSGRADDGQITTGPHEARLEVDGHESDDHGEPREGRLAGSTLDDTGGGVRVLQVTAIPTTARVFVLPLADALRERGHTVELAAGPGPDLRRLEQAGYRVHRLPISRRALSWRNLHALGALRGLLRGGAFDLVHTHTPAASALVRLAARRTPVPVLYTLHGSLWGPAVPAVRRHAFTLLERALASATDAVFAVNPEDARDCVRLAGHDPDRVSILPAGGAGVAPEFFEAGARGDDRSRLRVRARFDVPADSLVVGFVGRTVAAKGLADLAAAFTRIAAAEPRAMLLVVGDPLPGDRRAWGRGRFLAALGPELASRVRWLGFRDRVAPLVAAMDVVVLPSRREGFGMSLAEAAAVGRPVVATETRGARAVVEPGVTGALVPVGEPAALADAVLELIADPETAARMGAAARRRAAERFTREAVLTAYLERYDTFLRSGGPGSRGAG